MKDKNIKNNLYRLKSLLLQKKYINNKNIEFDIIYLMEKFIDNLKQINLIYTRADIESLHYSGTSYPDTLLKDEIDNRYSFFSIVLGYIDGIIENNLNNDIVQIIRDEVVNVCTKNMTIIDNQIIKDTITEKPCYKNFNNCYKEINYNNFSIIVNFLNYYNIGFESYNKYNIYDIYNVYFNLWNEYKEYIINNKKIVDEIRIKKKIL